MLFLTIARCLFFPKRYLVSSCFIFQHLQSFSCHESMVKVGAFILGEFGKLISRTDESSPKQQFHLLRSRLPCCSSETRAMLLSTFIKFARLFPEIKDEVQVAACRVARNILEQNLCELTRLSNVFEYILDLDMASELTLKLTLFNLVE